VGKRFSSKNGIIKAGPNIQPVNALLTIPKKMAYEFLSS